MSNKALEERVFRLVLEYAAAADAGQGLDPRLNLRSDLGVESLALVSLAIRLGEEFGADLAERGIELGTLQTVGDLIVLAGTAQGLGIQQARHAADRGKLVTK